MFLPKRFKYLDNKEIAGAETINPIVDFLRGIRSDSEFIDLNANANNSMTISFNEGVLFNWLKKASTNGEFKHSFQGTITQGNNGKISVSSGTVYMQENTINISGISNQSCTSGHVVYAVLSSASSGSLSYASSMGSGIVQPAGSGHGDRIVLPILRTVKNNGVWQIEYLHIGDYHFVNMPYFWISGYDKSKRQSLDHDENTNGFVWTEYGECEEEE